MLEIEDKKRIKELFSEYLDVSDSRTQLNKNATDIKKDVADILSIKTKQVTKLFSCMKKLYEDGENELEDLSNIIKDIQA